MKTISLCGRPAGCCPTIEDDKENGVIHIIDGEQKVTLNKEHIKKLTRYLMERWY